MGYIAEYDINITFCARFRLTCISYSKEIVKKKVSKIDLISKRNHQLQKSRITCVQFQFMERLLRETKSILNQIRNSHCFRYICRFPTWTGMATGMIRSLETVRLKCLCEMITLYYDAIDNNGYWTWTKCLCES